MTVPSKAYILRHNVELSQQYSRDAAASCDKIKLKYEYVEGYNTSIYASEAWNELKIFDKEWNPPNKHEKNTHKNKAALCTVSHAMIWKKVVEGSDECVIILEHDAIMLHKPTIDMPNDRIVALGYKLNNINRYNAKEAGPPQKLVPSSHHSGSHAYAITKTTANLLLDELREYGKPLGCIDTYYMQQKRTKIKLSITDPICALAHLRESTIWNRSANANGKLLPSFSKNLK